MKGNSAPDAAPYGALKKLQVLSTADLRCTNARCVLLVVAGKPTDDEKDKKEPIWPVHSTAQIGLCPLPLLWISAAVLLQLG